MVKTLFFIFLFEIFLIHAFGQSSNDFNPVFDNVLLPPPNASALSKFGDIPVGPATGIPQIGIPIYNFNSSHFSNAVNISLDYFAGGIHVDDESSCVGIGWALNGGGVITRTLNGIPDEDPSYGFISGKKFPEDEMAGNYYGYSSALHEIYAGRGDNASDVFSYNVGSFSGEFIFGKNGDMLLRNMEHIKIFKEVGNVKGNTCIISFTIIDENGIKYVFSDYEITHVQGIPNNFYISSWYLSKIISTNGDLITFNYSNIGYIYQQGVSGSEIKPLPGLGGTGHYLSAQGKMGSTIVTIDGRQLDNISFPNKTQVNFYYDNTKPIDNALGSNGYSYFLLDHIELTDGNFIKGFKLSQDKSVNRWTLRSVQPYSMNGNSRIFDKGYSMDYVGVLPDRLSYQQDHWGFYNVNNGPNASFLPSDYVTYNGGVLSIVGGNRDTDPEKVKAGSLLKMTYPTGGYSVFEMEANQAVHNWLNQRFDASYWTKEDIVGREFLSINQSTPYPNNSIISTYNGSLSSTNINIEVSTGSLTSNSGTINIEAYLEYGSGWRYVGMGTVTIKSVPSSVPYLTASFGLGGLTPGCKIKFVGYAQGTVFNSMVHLNWKEGVKDVEHSQIFEHKQPYVGGIRVKSITNYKEANSTNGEKLIFEYLNDDNSTSSGSLGTYPTYTYTVRYSPSTGGKNHTDNSWLELEPGYQANPHNFYIRSSNTVFSIANFNGSPVTYNRVKEMHIDDSGNNNGYSVYYYTSFSGSSPSVTNVFPFTPPNYLKWTIGQLTKKQCFDKNGLLQEETINTYSNKLSDYTSQQTRLDNFRCISVAPIQFNTDGPAPVGDASNYYDPNQFPYLFKMNSYYPVIGNSVLVKTNHNLYSTSQVSLSEIHEYTYDATQRFLLKDNYKASNGKLLNKTYKYVFNVDAESGSIMSQMKNNNMLKLPVRNEMYNDSKLLHAKEISYISPYLGFFAPSKIDYYIDKNVSTSLLFNSYSSYGNIQEQQKAGDVKEVYLWGYNGQYPVAKVIGSDIGTVSAKITQSILTNSATSDVDMRTELAKIRTAFANTPSVQVWTYTYKPLVGMTSETDPKGYTTFYEYDGFGRLQYAKDKDGNILKSYDYHYQHQ